jgi:hypothetical protein
VEDEPEETITREAPTRVGPIDVVMREAEQDDIVTEIAPVPAGAIPPGGDESVTKDRPPVAAALKPKLGSAPPPPRPSPVPAVGSFPSPLELPGPMIAAPSRPSRRVVAVDRIDADEALAETMQALPEQLAIHSLPPDHPFNYDEDLPPPPSYKNLGIALGFAFFAAFALLVFVIIRAATLADAAAPEQVQGPRLKARHAVDRPAPYDELAPRKRRAPRGK